MWDTAGGKAAKGSWVEPMPLISTIFGKLGELPRYQTLVCVLKPGEAAGVNTADWEDFSQL